MKLYSTPSIIHRCSGILCSFTSISISRQPFGSKYASSLSPNNRGFCSCKCVKLQRKPRSKSVIKLILVPQDSEKKAQGIPVPTQIFGGLTISGAAVEALKVLRISAANEIQDLTMNRIYDGESMIIHSETGSGKTLAYLLPLVQKYYLEKAVTAPKSVVIVCPNRELCLQVFRTLIHFLDYRMDAIKLFLPGDPTEYQPSLSKTKRLKLAKMQRSNRPENNPAPFFVGTPKHLWKVLGEKSLERIQCIVMDEMDKLIDISVLDANGRRVYPYGISRIQSRSQDAADYRKPGANLLRALYALNPSVQFVGCSATVCEHLKLDVGLLLHRRIKEFHLSFRRKNQLQREQFNSPQENVHVDDESEVGDLDENDEELVAELRWLEMKTLTFMRPKNQPNRAIEDDLRQHSIFYLRIDNAPTMTPIAPGVQGAAGGRKIRMMDNLKKLGYHPLPSYDDDDENPSFEITKTVSIPWHLVHFYVPVYDDLLEDKMEVIYGAMERLKPQKSLVLVPNDRRIKRVYAELRRVGVAFEDVALLSNLEGFEDHLTKSNEDICEASMDRAKRKEITNKSPCKVLIAHEDAMRGIHFDDLDLVFLYALPESVEEYQHLSGRVGRLGREGWVVSALTFEEIQTLRVWTQQIGIRLNLLPRSVLGNELIASEEDMEAFIESAMDQVIDQKHASSQKMSFRF